MIIKLFLVSRQFYTQFKYQQLPVWSKPCTITPPSPHQCKQLPLLGLWERPALVCTTTELRIQVSPPTQGDRQPLPSHTPPSFYHSCIPSLGSGGGSQRGKDFITLQHSSQCSWHSCQNLKVKAEFLREPAEGAYSSHLLYFPVGKRMSNTPPPLEVSEVLQSSQLHKDLLAERFPR